MISTRFRAAFLPALAAPMFLAAAASAQSCLTVTGPDSAVTCTQGAAGFLVAVTGGNGFYTYQWQVETSPGNWLTLGPTAIPLPCGGNSSAYASPLNSFGVTIGITPCPGPLTAPQHFQIRCLISSSCGPATSSEATYTICPADFNCSGGAHPVSVQDLFDFLAAWFSHDPSADFNGSGAISVQDLFDFLAAWFAGC